MMAEVDFDLIIADIILEEGTGMDILREVRRRNLGCPVVLVTGYPNVQSAAEAVRLGAQDYLVKPVTQNTLLRAVNTALRRKALEGGRDQRRSELEAIFRSIKEPIIAVNEQLEIMEMNDAVIEICGLSRESIGKPLVSSPPGCNGKCVEALRNTIATGQPADLFGLECKPKARPGLVVNLSISPLFDHQGELFGAVMMVVDRTPLPGPGQTTK
jgi:PAS domain S-box-containing protein